MQIDLHEIKRNGDDRRDVMVAKEALELALKAERGESPVGKIRARIVDKRHSSRMGGIRLGLRKFSGHGEVTHRALKSTTFDSSELVEKYDELKEIYEMKKERHKKAQKRKEKKKDKAEAILEEMKEVVENVDGLEEKFGRIREYNFGDEDIRIKANSDHKGVSLNLDNLTIDQFARILDTLI